MPLPLKPGYNFNFARLRRPPHFEMTAAEAYTDFYGLSYVVKGERMVYSPNGTTILQQGDMNFIPRYVYTRSTYVSEEPYEFILLKFTDAMLSDLFKVIGADAYNELCEESIIRFDKATQEKIVSILDDMEREWNNYNVYSELILKGLLYRLIIICLRERTLGGMPIYTLEKSMTAFPMRSNTSRSICAKILLWEKLPRGFTFHLRIYQKFLSISYILLFPILF